MESPDLTVRSKTQKDEQLERPHLSLVPTRQAKDSYWEPFVDAHEVAAEMGRDDSFFEITQHYLSTAISSEKAGHLLGALLTSDSLPVKATGQDLAQGVLEMPEKKSRPIIEEIFCEEDAARQLLEIVSDFESEEVTKLVLDAMKKKWWEKRQALVQRLEELRSSQVEN